MAKNKNDSIVGFIDMDCFYVAVEENGPLGKDISGPAAVVQYNSSDHNVQDCAPEDRSRLGVKFGGIIAVNYAARGRGVTRMMSGKEALNVCPEIILIRVPTKFGKADLSIYKKAGNAVVDILKKRATACEKRSVDEVAIDISEEADKILNRRKWDDVLLSAMKSSYLADDINSVKASKVSKIDNRKGHMEQGTTIDNTTQVSKLNAFETSNIEITSDTSNGWNKIHSLQERRLIAGAVIVSELRAQVTLELGYTCSGGIAVNKLLSKLGCGLHKPNQQTLVFPDATSCLLDGLAIDRLQGLGGMFGNNVKSSLIKNCSEYLDLDSQKNNNENSKNIDENISPKITCGMILKIPIEKLESLFGYEKGRYLFRMCNGIQDEKVQNRTETKSFCSEKTFFGNRIITTLSEVDKWLGEFAGELYERMVDHRKNYNQVPTLAGIGARIELNGEDSIHVSKSARIDIGRGGNSEKIAEIARSCFRKIPNINNVSFGVLSMGVSLSSFITLETNSSGLTKWMNTSSSSSSSSSLLSSSSSSIPSKPLPVSSSSIKNLFAPSSSSSSSSSPSLSSDRNNINSKMKVETTKDKSNKVIVDSKLLQEMTDIGIPKPQAQIALEKARNDVTLAFDIVFSHDNQTSSPPPPTSSSASSPSACLNENRHSIVVIKNQKREIESDSNSKLFQNFKNQKEKVHKNNPPPQHQPQPPSPPTFKGVQAHEVDESILACLPDSIVRDVRRQMALEAKSKKKRGSSVVAPLEKGIHPNIKKPHHS